MSSTLYFLLVLTTPLWTQLCGINSPISVAGVQITPSVYHGINIEITEDVPKEACLAILASLEKTMAHASATLHTALDGRFHFGDFNVFLPESWDDNCLPTANLTYLEATQRRTRSVQPLELIRAQPAVSNGEPIDLILTDGHAIMGHSMWTQQYGGCGKPGLRMYASYQSLKNDHSGREFVKEWAKYRYGVFDEIGYDTDSIYTKCYEKRADLMLLNSCLHKEPDYLEECSINTTQHELIHSIVDSTASNGIVSSLMSLPQIPSVTGFCNSENHNRYAPTKQNYMCDRRSTLEVILQHPDFAEKNIATRMISSSPKINTRPLFHYRRRAAARFVVIIDDTLDMAQRESWSFLRSAFRKWVLYDLQLDTEVGVIIANGQRIDKSLEPLPLSTTNRDLIASFLPYTPSSDTRQMACIECALQKALEMLEKRRVSNGDASHTIVIVAPGMSSATNVKEFQRVLHNARRRPHIATVDYPGLVGQRLPLAKLFENSIDDDHVLSFSVFERKFNSEKSYLTTYVELTNVLTAIGQHFYENKAQRFPIEIHRQTIYDDSSKNELNLVQGSTHRATGEFYLESNFGEPAGFYIYTHSVETPLIQAMRLISPSGQIYSSRSDQRMPVKQMSLLARLNETGRWRYEVDRYTGNPQPHVVQVTATPLDFQHVQVRSWWVRSSEHNFFTAYCEVRRGWYPVRNALVQATLRYRNKTDGYSEVTLGTIDLLDTGAGDSDIMLGDGIYGRHIALRHGTGIYSLEIYVRGTLNTYAIRHDADVSSLPSNTPCCGSEFVTPTLRDEVAMREAAIGNLPQNYRWRYTINTGLFERYAPRLIYYVDENSMAEFPASTATANEDNSHGFTYAGTTHTQLYGRILDLRTVAVGRTLNITWSPLDAVACQGCLKGVSYEIRYAYSPQDIIDGYESTTLLGYLDHPTSMNLPCIYTHDLFQTPDLFGRAYIAVRAFKEKALGTISNIAAVHLPLYAQTTLPPLSPSDQNFDKSSTSNGTSTVVTSDVGAGGFRDLLTLRYAIPLFIILIIILALVHLLCYFTRCRGSKKTKRLEECEKVNATHSTKASSSLKHVCMGIDAANTAACNYSLKPDHHTVGIPIYDEAEAFNKRSLSMSDTSQQGDASVAGICALPIISNNNLGVSGVSTGSEWPSTHDLLLPHNSGETQHMDDSILPPVPPLPAPMTLPMHDPQREYQIHYHRHHQQQSAHDLEYKLQPSLVKDDLSSRVNQQSTFIYTTMSDAPMHNDWSTRRLYDHNFPLDGEEEKRANGSATLERSTGYNTTCEPPLLPRYTHAVELRTDNLVLSNTSTAPDRRLRNVTIV